MKRVYMGIIAMLISLGLFILALFLGGKPQALSVVILYVVLLILFETWERKS